MAAALARKPALTVPCPIRPCFVPAGTCTVAGVLPMYFLINADVKNVLPLTIIAALLAGGLSGTVGPNMRCAAGLGWGWLLG